MKALLFIVAGLAAVCGLAGAEVQLGVAVTEVRKGQVAEDSHSAANPREGDQRLLLRLVTSGPAESPPVRLVTVRFEARAEVYHQVFRDGKWRVPLPTDRKEGGAEFTKAELAGKPAVATETVFRFTKFKADAKGIEREGPIIGDSDSGEWLGKTPLQVDFEEDFKGDEIGMKALATFGKLKAEAAWSAKLVRALLDAA